MSSIVYRSGSEEETKNIVSTLEKDMRNMLVFLCGDLGVGKTFFVKSYAELYDIHDVTSPTFSIVQRYENKKIKILHFDLYRIKSVEELDSIGFFDMIEDSESTIFIEWADKIDLVDDIKNFIKIDIARWESERTISVTY